jgi:hypothetical protein
MPRLLFLMAGLVPAIYVFGRQDFGAGKTRMSGARPGMTV